VRAIRPPCHAVVEDGDVIQVPSSWMWAHMDGGVTLTVDDPGSGAAAASGTLSVQGCNLPASPLRLSPERSYSLSIVILTVGPTWITTDDFVVGVESGASSPSSPTFRTTAENASYASLVMYRYGIVPYPGPYGD
jgi:hypothetical protein